MTMYLVHEANLLDESLLHCFFRRRGTADTITPQKERVGEVYKLHEVL